MAVRAANASDGNLPDLEIRAFRKLNDGTFAMAFCNPDGSNVATGAQSPVTSTSANAFTVGPGGNTSPSFNVDASTASAVNGLNIKSSASGSGVAVSVISSGATEPLTIDSKGSGALTLNGTATGAILLNGVRTVVTATATQAFDVGANGTTNPVFNVNSNAATVATGITVVGAAAAGGVSIAAISSGSNEALKLDAKGSGALVIAGTSTGQVSIGRGSVSTVLQSSTIGALGTTQNSTPTAAQLLGGVVTQTGATGAGTVTLPTGTQISTAVTGVAVGDTFTSWFANLGGGQTLTITGATGSTVIGTAAIGSGKNAEMLFVNTGANTWNVYVVVSA